MEQRVENYKEELRSYEYMVSRGLVKEAKTKEDLQLAVRQFKQMTSKHPERSVSAALAKLEGNKKGKQNLKSEEEDNENEDDQAAMEEENKQQM